MESGRIWLNPIKSDLSKKVSNLVGRTQEPNSHGLTIQLQQRWSEGELGLRYNRDDWRWLRKLGELEKQVIVDEAFFCWGWGERGRCRVRVGFGRNQRRRGLQEVGKTRQRSWNYDENSGRSVQALPIWFGWVSEARSWSEDVDKLVRSLVGVTRLR